jgi:ABC-2 type transport system permease protein
MSRDDMLRGLWTLVWLEIKIFVREPLGVIGTVAIPVIVFVAAGRAIGPGMRNPSADLPRFASVDLPILAAVVIMLNAVLSLVAIIAIYREGGILKRLRATPLRPHVILTAHVIVKLAFTGLTLGLMVPLAGRYYIPSDGTVPLTSFGVALLLSTLSIISLGFLIASTIRTARFAQPIGSLVLYPMMGLSGLFVPVEALPPILGAIARVLPLTYAVSLMRGIWHGDGWISHLGDVGILLLMFVALTMVSSRVFRWE